MRSDVNLDGPPGSLPPPGFAAKLTAIILCGMCVNELHWICAWVLATLSGGS